MVVHGWVMAEPWFLFAVGCNYECHQILPCDLFLSLFLSRGQVTSSTTSLFQTMNRSCFWAFTLLDQSLKVTFWTRTGSIIKQPAKVLYTPRAFQPSDHLIWMTRWWIISRSGRRGLEESLRGILSSPTCSEMIKALEWRLSGLCLF